MEKRKTEGQNAAVVRANRLVDAVGRASCGLVIPASETMALASRLPDWDEVQVTHGKYLVLVGFLASY